MFGNSFTAQSLKILRADWSIWDHLSDTESGFAVGVGLEESVGVGLGVGDGVGDGIGLEESVGVGDKDGFGERVDVV